MRTAEIKQVRELAQKLYPLLCGRQPEIVTAALADCVAMVIAGHIIYGDPEATRELRDAMLENLVATIRELIEVNARQIHGVGFRR